MEILELSENEYTTLVRENVPVFSRAEFLNVNADKVDKVHYLSGKEGKHRVLLAIGEKDGEWRAPFSAPFSNIIFLREDISLEHIWNFVSALIVYIKEQKGKLINIYLPADIYGAQQNAKIYNALLGNGFQIDFLDVNYSFDLNNFEMHSYEDLLHYNAKKNLHIAMKCNHSFLHCKTEKEKEEAYDIIKINREHRGFPLRMTKEQLMETINVVDHDFFLIKHENKSIASAVVYRLTNEIAQVAYWGDVPNVGKWKPINFLAYNLVKYYKLPVYFK